VRTHDVLVIVNNPAEPKAALKVAAVARRTGVSVRTLHYYEEIGLLKPSGRTSSGHRLYTAPDIQRLQQILSLRQLGLSLSDIGDCLTEGRTDARQVIEDHLDKVVEQRSALERLETQLRKLSDQLQGDGLGDAQTTETLLNALELITMYEKYFTAEQQQRLEVHANSGEEAVTPIVEELEAARQRGLPPSDDEAQRLWQRFREAVEFVSDGDADMTGAIFKLLHSEKKAREDHGISEELFAYLGSIAGGSEH
jgi:DNA-binding transcriptional MerR regulator